MGWLLAGAAVLFMILGIMIAQDSDETGFISGACLFFGILFLWIYAVKKDPEHRVIKTDELIKYDIEVTNYLGVSDTVYYYYIHEFNVVDLDDMEKKINKRKELIIKKQKVIGCKEFPYMDVCDGYPNNCKDCSEAIKD